MSFSSIVNNGFVQDVQKKAMVTIEKDRNRYLHVYKIIEEYCSINNIIISNLYVLLDKQNDNQNITNKVYNVYTSNPLYHGNKLTNMIHERSINLPEAKFIKFKTVKEQEEFTIEYDTRLLVTLFKIQKFKTNINNKGGFKEPHEIIKPVKINTNTYLPAEIEMIDIYHTLYDINKFSEFATMESFEKLLYDQFIERHDKGLISGSYESCKERQKDLLEFLKLSIVKDWIPKQNNVILIGIWAHNWLLVRDDICTDPEKIQLISTMNYLELLNILQRYISNITKFQISVREQALHIPKDFRMNRYTYYLHIVTERGIVEKPFLDLFNCAEFELIPYTKVPSKDKKITIFIGNKYVSLRFLFIDLWILRLIKTMGIIQQDILDKKITKLMQIITKFRGSLGDEIQDDNFMGIFRNYEIDKKRFIKEGKKYYPYYPELYFRENKKYRVIN